MSMRGVLGWLVVSVAAGAAAEREWTLEAARREWHFVEQETHWAMYEIFLERDDLPRFLELAFNNLAAAIHPDFRVGCEARDGIPAVAPGDAERWRMVRGMFVNERGGHDGSRQSLWLMQALPRAWLKPGSRLSVENMGTHFGGRVSLDAKVAEDGSLAVRATLDLAVAPAEIRLRLRSGEGRPLVCARVNGAAARLLEGDVIELPARRRGEYRIIGRFSFDPGGKEVRPR